jgi:hypothetical protein
MGLVPFRIGFLIARQVLAHLLGIQDQTQPDVAEAASN